MIDTAALQHDLVAAAESIASRPLAEFLQERGVLQQLTRDHLIRQLVASVQIAKDEEASLLAQLWQGLPSPPPSELRGDWLSAAPESFRPVLSQRWHQLRLRQWVELAYEDQLENYFLERRTSLERVVYRMLCVRSVGLAEEIFFRLMDDEADFGVLARQYSIGDERFTYGLVGPMPIEQPHQAIQTALAKLAVGEIASPIRVDDLIVLLQLEHREPARLDDDTRLKLLQELLERQIEPIIKECIAAVYPRLLAIATPLNPVPDQAPSESLLPPATATATATAPASPSAGPATAGTGVTAPTTLVGSAEN
ncbi:peptidylprolyl isomerase [Vulcanococcus limneticus]|uniref:peptidylprolyl isomerase n=1 Tax=Vulcanococcus limneticus TaxID=2170428 RepID=UPI00398C021D